MTVVLMFIAKHWKWFASGFTGFCLLVAVHTWWTRHNATIYQAGISAERIRWQDSVRVKYDTLIVHDTVKLSRLAIRYDTLRDTVLAHLSDTVLVKQFIAVTDSGKKVCTEQANDCAAFRLAANQEIATLKAQHVVTIYSATWGQRGKYAAEGALAAWVACAALRKHLCQ